MEYAFAGKKTQKYDQQNQDTRPERATSKGFVESLDDIIGYISC